MWTLPQFSQIVALQYYFVVILIIILHLCPSIQALVSYSSFLLYPSLDPHASHFFSNQTDIIQIRMWHTVSQMRLQPWDDGGAKPSPVCWLLYCATEKEAPWNTWRWVSIHLVLLGCSEICHRKPTERLPRSWNWGGKKAFVESVLLFFFAGLMIDKHKSPLTALTCRKTE